MLTFQESTKKYELKYTLVPVREELKILGEVFYGLLSFFVFTEFSIADQIKSISTAAYLLFYLFQNQSTSIMPSQLYHDLQASFQDALFCCAKAKEYTPDQPLYLMLDGTDLLERFFGDMSLNFKG